MRNRTVSARGRWTAVVAIVLFLGGCAVEQRGSGAQRPVVAGEGASGRGSVAARSDTVSRPTPYDVETEAPEKTRQTPAQFVETVSPVKPDTFNVRDVAVEPAAKEPPAKLYAVGYRIQVFASSDRAAAEKMKQRVVAQTGMPAYIEYEEGLYKVRVGDFSDRKDASQARQKLLRLYPGSWIARTTIRLAS